MAQKKKVRKKIARSRRGAKVSASASKASRSRKNASPRAKAAVRKKTVRKSARKPAPRKKSAARKAAPAVRAKVRGKAARARVAATSRISAPRESPAAGEVYGEGSWREEELSAAELERGVPQLHETEAEVEGPEAAEESDDSEW